MLDIGWTELLVIAIVLIVVVGPKDLPPMIRAFGKTMASLRRMAGEFRTQFDDALREADLDDVRKTIADAQNLNPANGLRDALNPLRQMGEEIKADLRKVTTPPVSPAEMSAPSALETPAAPEAPVTASETPPAPLVSTPPAVNEPTPVSVPSAAAAKPKAVRKPRAKATVEPVAEAPAAKPRKTAAKPKATASEPVKKAAPRKKKTTEAGKDEA
ncbi:MAG: twin-arginine translocase subunit TatB [Shinella sp.]|nr:MAG: twin-arginine translocase subunit TatB [Shinella sp.]